MIHCRRRQQDCPSHQVRRSATNSADSQGSIQAGSRTNAASGVAFRIRRQMSTSPPNQRSPDTFARPVFDEANPTLDSNPTSIFSTKNKSSTCGTSGTIPIDRYSIRGQVQDGYIEIYHSEPLEFLLTVHHLQRHLITYLTTVPHLY